MMKLFSSIFFILGVLIFNSSAQIIDLKIKDVGIGTNYSEVLRKLGKPLSNQTDGTFPCEDGKVITLNYSGLSLKIIEDFDSKNFFVASVNLTSNKFSVSEINIGATVKEVKTKFGDVEIETEKGTDVLSYFIDDGYAYFYFTNGKLRRVSWELNVC